MDFLWANTRTRSKGRDGRVLTPDLGVKHEKKGRHLHRLMDVLYRRYTPSPIPLLALCLLLFEVAFILLPSGNLAYRGGGMREQHLYMVKLVVT